MLQASKPTRLEKKCCRSRQFCILNAATDDRNALKMANIVTENQNNSVINFPVFYVYIYGIDTLNYRLIYLLKIEMLSQRKAVYRQHLQDEIRFSIVKLNFK